MVRVCETFPPGIVVLEAFELDFAGAVGNASHGGGYLMGALVVVVFVGLAGGEQDRAFQIVLELVDFGGGDEYIPLGFFADR